MEIKETAELCLSIRQATHAWSKESDDEFEQIVRFWHKCLKDVPFDFAENALVDFLSTNKFPPTIADIKKPWLDHLESKKEKNKQLREIYYRTIAYYPCYIDTDETKNEWMRITGNNIEAALRFERWLIDFVRQSEKSGTDFKPFEDFMKGVKQIE